MRKLLVLAALALLIIFGACPSKDTEPPTIAITTPANGDSILPDTVTIIAHATDNKGVTKVEFFDSSDKIGTDSSEDGDTLFYIRWSAAVGAHTLKAKAYDAAENIAEDTVSVIVTPSAHDTTKPTVTIAYPADGSTVGAGTVVIKAVATDNVAVARVEFYDGSTSLGADSVGTADTFDVTWVANIGPHTLKAVASDAVGNSAEAQASVGVSSYHGGVLTADEVWHAAGNPHVCTTTVVIDGGHKLTIEPGCEVRFWLGAAIIVGQASGGALLAVGKPDTLIRFTSDSSAPSPGNWNGIAFYANAVPTTHLSYCGLDYGGASSAGALVANPGAQFSVDHCTISHSAGSGLFCEGDGHPTDFTNNSITGGLGYPVRVKAEYLRTIGTGNVLTGNAPDMDAVLVVGSNVMTSATWHNLGVPYLLSGDLFIGDASAPVITIEPGTTIKLALNTAITIGYNLLPGALKADAMGGQQILFTSASANPARGDWVYIDFDLGTIDSESKLKNCAIKLGGRNGSDGEIYLYNANPEISGCAVDSSAGYGIYLDGDQSELPDPAVLRADNTFLDNELGDVFGP